MKNSLLVLSGDDVEYLVQNALEPSELVQCMARTFELVSGSEIGVGVTQEHDRVQQPPRLTTLSPNHSTLYMPCRLPSSVTGSSDANDSIHTAIKVVSVSRKGGPGGIPGTTLVLDEQTGAVRAVVNARALTALRNAAGSVLASQLLANPNPTHLVLFGAGLQIKQHARIFLHTYPSIISCTIVNRSDNERFANLVAYLRSEFPNVRVHPLTSTSAPNADIEQAVRQADLICTATSSSVPLFHSSWPKSGAHINLVGSYTPAMREVDSDLITKRASRRVVVDEAKSCLVEAGELVDAEVLEKELVELGVLVGEGGSGTNRAMVRSAGDVTVFKSVGVGAQDVAVAALMVELAERDEKVGVRVPYD